MTVKEIAELAEVSIGTVDRVLYCRGRVSAATREKVEAIIARYQFTPNPIARRLKRNRAYRFCALIPRRDQDSGYWGQALNGIRGGADEVASLGVETEIVEYDRYSPGSFCSATGDILKWKTDGVLFAPVVPEESDFFVKVLQDANIPYVFFDADFPGARPLCAIGQDSFKGGYLAGRLMNLFAGTITRPVAVLGRLWQEYHMTRRRDGFLAYAAEHSFSAVTWEYSDSQGLELSAEEISRYLREHSDLTGAFITNSFTHRIAGAAKPLRDKGNFIIIGYDLIPANHILLREGAIDAIISQRPEYQGRRALLDLYRNIVLGRKVAARAEIPLDVYIRENVPSELIPAAVYPDEDSPV
jgi:LacI family transcriptional regulator